MYDNINLTCGVKMINIAGLRGDGIVVLGVEKRSVPKLQDERTVRKVTLIKFLVTARFI